MKAAAPSNLPNLDKGDERKKEVVAAQNPQQIEGSSSSSTMTIDEQHHHQQAAAATARIVSSATPHGSEIQMPVVTINDETSIRLLIPRNYAKGLTVQFSTAMPPELLQAKIDKKRYEKLIYFINQMFLKTEELSVLNVVIGLSNLLFCNVPSLFIRNRTTIIFDKILDRIYEENSEYFNRFGVNITDPMRYCLRYIEIHISRSQAI